MKGTEHIPGADLVLSEGEPALLTVTEADASGTAAHWLSRHRDAIRAAVTRSGHLLIRGLAISDPAGFTAARDVLMEAAPRRSREETTPRTDFGDGVFSATDLPQDFTIRLHNEDSYSTAFPGTLLFCCVKAAGSGGATTLGDSRRVLSALPGELVDRFRARGWMVTRNFASRLGLSWQQAFGTDDRSAVEAYCRRRQVGREWLPGGGLRTTAVRAATLRHPVTGEESWFNHIAVFNEWTHEPEIREVLLATYGAGGLPQNTRYGDGEPIEPDVIATLNAAYDDAMIRVPWQAGDLLLVDNILCSHGREPYTGERKVLVSLGSAVDVRACGPSSPIGPAPKASEENR